MKETNTSLRAYLLLAAILQGVGSIPALFHAAPTLPALFVGVVGGAVALAYLYLSVSLRGLLPGSLTLVVRILYFGAAYQIAIVLMFVALSMVEARDFGVLAITLLVIWYLINSVRRLARRPR